MSDDYQLPELPPELWDAHAKSAYRAYGSVTNWKNYQGLPMPEWENLPDGIRAAWVAAVQQVWTDLRVVITSD